MIIVKLGGSLFNTPELVLWLQRLAETSRSIPIVIVPGGGPFADVVRKAQTQHHFNDKTAHHMALIAMKQFGLMLSALEENCLPFDIHKPEQPLSVWLPDDALLSEPTLIHSWDLTSDSLALWLASQLKAEQLLLVKRIHVNSTSIKQLSNNQIIDRSFADLFTDAAIPTRIIHYQSQVNFIDYINHRDDKTHLYLT